MNKGFGVYYKNGLNAAVTALYKKKGLLPYLGYLIMSLLGRLLLLPGVVFDLSHVRLAKNVQSGGRVSVGASLRAADKGSTLGTMLLVRLMQVLMLLAGILIGALAGGALGMIGAAVAWAVDAVELVVLLLAIPAGVFAAGVAFFMVLYFAPAPYVVDSNEGFTMSGTLHVCYQTMKQRGKRTHLAIWLTSLLLIGLFAALVVGPVWLALLASSAVAMAVAMVAATLLLLGFVAVAPLFVLAARVADCALMDDISLDPSNAKKHVKEVVVVRGTKTAKDYGHDRALLDLFDSEGDDVRIDSFEEAPRTSAQAQQGQDAFIKQSQPEPEAAPAPEPPEADPRPQAEEGPAPEPTPEEPQPPVESAEPNEKTETPEKPVRRPATKRAALDREKPVRTAKRAATTEQEQVDDL